MVLTYGLDKAGNRIMLIGLTSDDTEQLIDRDTLCIPGKTWPTLNILYRDNAEDATQALIDLAVRERLCVGDVKEIPS